MLCRNILVTLLVATISILRGGASEDGEQRALPNVPQKPTDKCGPLLGALTIQKDNVYKTGSNDQSIYGSIAQEETEVYESPDSSRPSSTRTRTASAPGGPGHQGVSYARLGEIVGQEQPQQNQNPGDGVGISCGSYTYQEGNIYITGQNDSSSYGSKTVHKNRKFESGGSDNQAPQNKDTGNTNGTNQVHNFFGSITHQVDK